MQSIQTIKPSRLLNGTTRRIQGINSKIDDVKLLGSSFKAAIDQAIVEPGITLERGIDLSSTLTIPVHDPDGELWRSKLLEARFDLELDGLWFRFVAANPTGDLLTLTCEAREVAKLRRHFGPESTVRGKTTRAEFVVGLWLKALGKRAHIYCPQLHTRQPIKNERAAREDAAERDIRRDRGLESGGGLDSGAKLTVKGERADAEQLRNGDIILRVGESVDAPQLAMVAAITAAIGESEIRRSAVNPSSGAAGVFQLIPSTAAATGLDPQDVAATAKRFYLEGYYSYGGAIKLAGEGYTPGEIASMVEGSDAGGSFYDAYAAEARDWVDAFNGGEVSTSGGSVDVTTSRDYKFTVPANENFWDAAKRLGDEVNWRRFEAAGVLYYIAETDLLKSRPRMRVSRDTPGISELTCDYNLGKKVNEASFVAQTKDWAAPPGTVVILEDEGPASGRYIVSTISTVLGRPTAQIEIKRPTAALPEPAAETKTKTIKADVRGGGSAGGGASTDSLDGVTIKSTAAGAPAWGGAMYVFDQFIDAFMTEGGATIGGRKEEGHAPDGDHDPSEPTSYATDYPIANGQSLARSLAQAMGFSGWQYNAYAPTFNITVDGNRYRVQILNGPAIEHPSHVHVGLRLI